MDIRKDSLYERNYSVRTKPIPMRKEYVFAFFDSLSLLPVVLAGIAVRPIYDYFQKVARSNPQDDSVPRR